MIKEGTSVNRDEEFTMEFIPFTSGQQWLLDGLNGTPPLYRNIIRVCEVLRPLDPAILEQTVQHLLAYHDMLRLQLVKSGDEWKQYITDAAEAAPFTWIDLSEIAEEEQESHFIEADFQIQAEVNSYRRWLFHIAFFDCGAAKPGKLLFIFSHFLADNFSLQIILDDLQRVYLQLEQGKECSLPPKTASFQQWAQRLTTYLHSAELQQELESYWLKLPWDKVVSIPLDFPEGKSHDTRATSRVVEVTLNAHETALLTRCQASGLQVMEILLTALARTLSWWAGSPVHSVLIQYHGRFGVFEDLGLWRTIGYFAFGRTHLLDVSAAQTPGDALQHIKAQFRALPHQGIGIDLITMLGNESMQAKIQKISPPEVHVNYFGKIVASPVASSFLTPIHEPHTAWGDGKQRRERVLSWSGMIIKDQLHIYWEYGSNIHTRETIEKVSAYFIETLRNTIHYLLPQSSPL